MNKKIDDLSVESALDLLFSTEEETTDETALPAIDKEELGELTEDEAEVLDMPVEEEEGADEEAVAEESARLFGEIGTLQLAMRTAEEFIWSRSEEADDAAKVSMAKKFWDWLLKIIEKIRMFVITTVKRIQIWLTGDMKAITKFAKENGTAINDAITKVGDKVTLNIKLPKSSVVSAKIELPVDEDLSKAIAALNKSEYDEAAVSALESGIKEKTVKSVSEEIYGKDVKAAAVSAKAFDIVVKIVATMENAESFKKSLGVMVKQTKSTVNVSAAIKKAKEAKVEAKDLANLKKEGVMIQKAINSSVSLAYWQVSAGIAQVKIARKYAAKVLDEAKKGEKK